MPQYHGEDRVWTDVERKTATTDVLLIPDGYRPRYLMPIDRKITAQDFKRSASVPLVNRGRTLPVLRKLDRAHKIALKADAKRKVKIIKADARPVPSDDLVLRTVARDVMINKIRRARPLTPNAARTAFDRLFVR